MRKLLSFIALSQLFVLTAFAGPEDKKFEELLATHWEYLMRDSCNPVGIECGVTNVSR